MLKQIAEGVLIHESEFFQSNAVVVQGKAGVLLIDPGITGYEMVAIADDVHDVGSACCGRLLDAPALGPRALARQVRRSAPLRYSPLRG